MVISSLIYVFTFRTVCWKVACCFCKHCFTELFTEIKEYEVSLFIKLYTFSLFSLSIQLYHLGKTSHTTMIMWCGAMVTGTQINRQTNREKQTDSIKTDRQKNGQRDWQTDWQKIIQLIKTIMFLFFQCLTGFVTSFTPRRRFASIFFRIFNLRTVYRKTEWSRHKHW